MINSIKNKLKFTALAALLLSLVCCAIIAFVGIGNKSKTAYAETSEQEGGVSAYSQEDLVTAWNNAVSSSSSSEQVTFTLTENWTADSTTHAFGEGVGFKDGRIYVPAGANVKLDLNGFKLDRGLCKIETEEATPIPNGSVIYSEGDLEIADTSASKAGVITGGCWDESNSEVATEEDYNASAGGVEVNGGNLTISGGTIFGNAAMYGFGGVYVKNGNLTMTGGTVSDNVGILGGGVLVINGTFEMADGVISNHQNYYGFAGGVAIMGNFIMNGGEITGNNGGEGASGGVLVSSGMFTMNGGKISGNEIFRGNGGGVNLVESTFTMNGGEISGNRTGRDGGGFYVENSTFIMNGGTITGNRAIPGLSDLTSTGGGVCFSGDCTFIMTDGEISGNTAGTVGNDIGVEGSYGKMSAAWQQAVEISLVNPDIQVGVALNSMWYADSTTHSFGTGTGFSNGRIHVPAGANIQLCLMGWSIDRGLTSETTDGSVFLVEGTLNIKNYDFGGATQITGGNTNYGGGIYIDGGNLILNAGNITGNTASTNGAGVIVRGGTFTMNGGSITNNTSANGGGGVYVLEGTFTMNGGSIYGNTANAGGGIWMLQGATFIMNGGEISNNTAQNGGAISTNSQSVIELNGGEISGNTATDRYGGGICLQSSTLTINAGTITGNESANMGGGIYTSGSTVTINGGTISDNTATNGGGIEIYGKVIMNDGNITGNHANSAGGGLCFGSSATLEMHGGTISGNTAKNGGGLYLYNLNTVTMYGGTISNNTAEVYGGGVFLNYYTGSSKVTLLGGTISGNTAKSGGGVFVNTKCTLEANGGEISGNKGGTGRGVYLNGTDAKFILNDGAISNHEGYQVVYINNAIFEMNGGKISDNGYESCYADSLGCIDLEGTDPKFIMNGGEISDNTGTYNGGAVSITKGSFTMNGGTISGNRAQYSGGGVYVASGSMFTMNGGEISGNDGGGVYISNGTINLNGGKIIGNTASSGGGGIYFSSGTFNVSGGMVYNNTVNSARNNIGTTAYPGAFMNITGKLSASGKTATRIGIFLSPPQSSAFTSGYTTAGNKVADVATFFFSDNYKITTTAEGEVSITAGSTSLSTLTWRYSVNGGTTTTLAGDTYSVAYTGAYYSVSPSSVSVQYAVDENGASVSNISKVGKYYFTVASAGSYYNPTFMFEITPGSIEGAQISVDSTYVYNGKAITPKLSVTLGGKRLEEGVDFTVSSYSNNVNAGTANVTISGIGNYKGTAKGTFAIEKRNLNIRWGDTQAEYNGSAKAIKAVVEGLLGSDKVSVKLTYAQNGKTITPVDAGEYTVTAEITSTNYKLADNADVTCQFTIKPTYVVAIWSGSVFEYNGEEQKPTAKYINVYGKEVAVAVTVDDTPVDVGEYTAEAVVKANSNYIFTNLTFDYEIVKTAATAEWGNGNLTYNGTENVPELTVTGIGGEDLSDGVTLVYYQYGIALEGAPVNVGEYVVKATLTDDNYKLVSEYSFTIVKAQMTVDSVYTDTTFTGLGKTPEITATANDEELEVIITYAVQGSGNYTEELPVNVGNYTAKIVEVNGNYEDETVNFAITKATVAISWSLDKQSVKVVTSNKTTYKWLYDGKAHAPVATAIFEIDGEEVELELTVNGITAIGTYSVTAALKNTEFNNNFTITNTTAYVEIVRSSLNEVVWYENGATDPLEEGDEPSYKYIAVYGENGPKLRAYGAATLTGVDDEGESLTVTTLIPLKVSYPEFVRNGFWAARDDAYTAEASLPSVYAPYCDMKATERTIEFYVTDLTTDEEYADVRWVVEVDGEFIDAEDYEFFYNGSAQAPKAIVILDEDKFDEDPTDTTSFAYLPVGGERTNAGTYYAYILPCRFLIDENDAELEFTINPLDVTVTWTVGEYTYNGTAQAPVAKVGGTGGLACNVSVAGFVEAGKHTAIAVVDKNFNIVSGETQEFTVEKLTLTADKVEWDCDENGVWREDGFFAWDYDGELHLPTAEMRVRINGEIVPITLAVTGSASSVGTHYAYAILANTDKNNSNYAFAGARVRFDIVLDTISHIYWSDEDASGNIYYTYDGNSHLPTAYYMSGAVRVDLNVIGERTEAGTYIAYVTDNLDFSVSTRHSFTILPQPLTVSWSRVDTIYNGAEQHPVAKFANEDGETVYLDSDDYTITGFTGAGKYTAEIFSLNDNYTFVNATCEYTVKAIEITLTWLGNDDGTFAWEYDGEKHAPTVSHAVSGVTVTVIGGESGVGSYTAVAVCDNGNYVLKNATQTYEINPYEITVVWTVGEYTYDGENSFAPTATYTDWNGEEHVLVVKGARMDAGEGVAEAILPENCVFKYESGENAGTHTFEVNRLLLTEISWTGNDDGSFVWEFNGQTHCPVATAGTVTIAITGGAVNAGKYEATAEPANYENYAFAEGVEVKKEFEITPKTVDVKWYGENGNEDDNFEWQYDGALHVPSAKFEDVTGSLVLVPVNGATANSGEHQAIAIDVFNNYNLGKLTTTQSFRINGTEVTAVWTGGTYNDTDDVYEYEFNGQAQQPLASATGVQFSYTIKNANGDVVNAAISAGDYTVTVVATNKNYSVSENSRTVNVKIKPMTVSVQWGELELGYTGASLVPEAWFLDTNGQRVKLEVSGAQTEAGENYTATVDFITATGDYVLDGDLTNQFSIIKETATDVYWDWSTNSWKVRGSDEGEEPDNGTTEDND